MQERDRERESSVGDGTNEGLCKWGGYDTIKGWRQSTDAPTVGVTSPSTCSRSQMGLPATVTKCRLSRGRDDSGCQVLYTWDVDTIEHVTARVRRGDT